MNGPDLLLVLVLYAVAAALMGALVEYDPEAWAFGVFVLAVAIAGGLDLAIWVRARLAGEP